jgi:glycosyltransferase involved in cell wall biosynthesis
MTGRNAPRILAIADRPGWAIDNKTQNLQRALAGRFEIVKRFQHEVTAEELTDADIVLIYYWLELLKIPLPESVLIQCAQRLIIGICSHEELAAERREPGLAILRRLPCAVFVNNRSLEREFAPLLDVPVHYTPNGVDTLFFCPLHTPRARHVGEIRVGWTGSLENFGPIHRGFHDVVEPAIGAVACATLVTAIREEYWRNRNEMLDFYCELDVYVCASRSEGTPNPCLEAAACGVPLLTTRVGNMPELIRDGENGLFFDGSAAHLAAMITLLRDAPQYASELSEGMLKTIREWDWLRQAENYARMFDKVLCSMPVGRRSRLSSNSTTNPVAGATAAGTSWWPRVGPPPQ